jgi:hypothetical protein
VPLLPIALTAVQSLNPPSPISFSSTLGSTVVLRDACNRTRSVLCSASPALSEMEAFPNDQRTLTRERSPIQPILGVEDQSGASELLDYIRSSQCVRETMPGSFALTPGKLFVVRCLCRD